MYRTRCILLCFDTLAGWRATAQMCTKNKKKIATALMFSLSNKYTCWVYPFCLKCEIKMNECIFFSATMNHLCKSFDRLHFCLRTNNEYKWQFHPFDDSFQRCGFSSHKKEKSYTKTHADIVHKGKLYTKMRYLTLTMNKFVRNIFR